MTDRIPLVIRRTPSVRASFTCAVVTALLALTVHAGSAVAAPAQVDVQITKFTFAPKEITVAPGTKIVWTNRDEAPHTVTSTDKKFASKGMDTDDKFERVFESEGDFNYICTVHPFMTGVVHVHKQ